MTLLLTVTTPFGLVMAADTRLSFYSDREPEDDHRKIVPWSEMRAAVGFAGLATLSTGMTDELLEKLIREGRYTTLGEYAAAVANALDRALPPPRSGIDRRVYVHVAGFGPKGLDDPPELHYVRNAERENATEKFKMDEDLRTTYLAGLRVRSCSDLAAIRAFRVQFSGERETFARRAQENLDREASGLRDINGVAIWARGQIRAVAADLKKARRRETISAETVAWILATDGIREHSEKTRPRT